MIIWSCILFIIFHQCYSEKELVFVSDENVCIKGMIRSCCYNYYYDKGTCKACERGQRSTDKRTCTPCPSDTYGEICKFHCRCTLEQTCDPVLGCINLLTLKTEEMVQSTVGRLTDNTLNISKVITAPTETKTVEGPNMKTIYFVVVAGGLVGWLVLCVSVGWLIFRRLSRKRTHTQTDRSSQERNIQDPTALVELPAEHVYHDIEEIPTPPPLPKRSSSYLSVYDRESSDSSPGITSCVQFKAEINIDENISSESAQSSLSRSSKISVCNQIILDAEGYLHPYTSLEPNNEQKNI